MVDAETYDSYLVPAIFEPWSRELIKRAQVWKGDRVLDVACGTGIVACRLAATGATVTGLDADPDRIARAKLRAQDEGVGVRWLEGAAEALPFRQPAFDLVTCQQGLQFCDHALAAREARRVIAPGGRAAIATWCGIEHQGPSRLLDDLVFRRAGTRSTAPYALSDAATLSELLTAAKFFAVNVETVTRQVRVPEPVRYVTTILTNMLGAPAPEEAITEGLAAIAPFVDGDQVVFATTSLVAIGRVKT